MKFCILAFCCVFIAFSGAQQNGDIRLGSPDFFARGRLEVYLGGQWGTVCYNPNKRDEQKGFAQVACQQLGFQDLQDVNTVQKLNIPGGEGPVNLAHVGCPFISNPVDGPQHILRCDYQRPQSSDNCEHTMDMGVDCVQLRREAKAYDAMVDIINDISQPYTSQSSGLAQVYLNGEWGPVCNMTKPDADSLCRQLGYTNAVSVENRNITSNRAEVLNSFRCRASQPCLKDCFLYPNPNSEVNCDQHYSYVTCTFDQSRPSESYGTGRVCVAQQYGDIRLASPDFFGRGRLEVYIDGAWGTVCYDASKPDEQRGFAQAACQQLGRQNVEDVNTVAELGLPGGEGAIHLFHVGCTYQDEPLNGPQHVLRCDYQTSPDRTCTHAMDMGVVCVPLPKADKPYDAMVDIVNDISQAYVSQSSGLAQVYLNGEWGPVCNMNGADADSLCRQLGYTSSDVAENRNITSDRAEMLDTFTCDQSQTCLKDCFKYPKADATVNCNRMYSYVTCLFEPNEKDLDFGTQKTCAYRRSNRGKVAGAVIGTLLILATIAIVAVLVVCLFYPSCKLYKIWESKKLPTLSGLVGKGGTKYESI